MINIPLQAIPNQSLSTVLDNTQFDIVVRVAGDIMAVDITINNVVILTGQRASPGCPLIPYQYLENGNFFLLTENNDYPDYTKFGVDQFLVYASPDELAV